jgi:glucosamine kinase
MNYYLGFDGGGTKTECVALDARGNVVAQAVAGASNPLRVGFEQAFAALRTAAQTVLTQGNIEPRQVHAVCAGLAGAGRPGVASRVARFLEKTFPDCLTRVTTDLEIALEAAAGAGPGVVLIAGTGSSAYGRNAAGETARAGGYGPWIGDEGSAFDIGRCAVAAVARSRDLAAPPLGLGEKILAALAISDWDELTERIAADADSIFPQIFPVIAEAADAGDVTAHDILFAAATALADLAGMVVRRLGMEKVEFRLGKAGGVFIRSTVLEARLDSLLASSFSCAAIGPLEVPAVVGAARLAARLAGARAEGAAHDSKA